MIEKFHGFCVRRWRGDGLPARLRFAAHRGVTLVELMISMLILTIVCVSWLKIIGVQSAKKEARRREAVECLAGMMDAFMYLNRDPYEIEFDLFGYGYYVKREGLNSISFESAEGSDYHSIFDDNEIIRYQICVGTRDALLDSDLGFSQSTGNDGWVDPEGGEFLWLVGRLYELKGSVFKPFFTLSVCTGMRFY